VQSFAFGYNGITKKWTMPVRDWNIFVSQFAILFEERFPIDLTI
jgi:transposase-like protein